MDPLSAVVAILVALITGGYLKRRNTKEHEQGRELVMHVSRQVGDLSAAVTDMDQRHEKKLDVLDERLDSAATWQAEHEHQHQLHDVAEAAKAAAKSEVVLKVVDSHGQ